VKERVIGRFHSFCRLNAIAAEFFHESFEGSSLNWNSGDALKDLPRRVLFSSTGDAQ
jgi:hypothetical protein